VLLLLIDSRAQQSAARTSDIKALSRNMTAWDQQNSQGQTTSDLEKNALTKISRLQHERDRVVQEAKKTTRFRKERDAARVTSDELKQNRAKVGSSN
jgi:hypothetical protein